MLCQEKSQIQHMLIFFPNLFEREPNNVLLCALISAFNKAWCFAALRATVNSCQFASVNTKHHQVSVFHVMKSQSTAIAFSSVTFQTMGLVCIDGFSGHSNWYNRSISEHVYWYRHCHLGLLHTAWILCLDLKCTRICPAKLFGFWISYMFWKLLMVCETKTSAVTRAQVMQNVVSWIRGLNDIPFLLARSGNHYITYNHSLPVTRRSIYQ